LKSITFVLPSVKSGGGNRVVLELANELVLRGYQVDIICPNNSNGKIPYDLSDKVRLIKVGCYKNTIFSKLKNMLLLFLKINRIYRGNILIFTDPLMSIFTPMIRSNKIIRFIQADDYNLFDDLMLLKNKYILYIYKLLTRISYKYKIEYIFNSNYTYMKFVEYSNRKGVKRIIVHPAVNNKVFKNEEIRDEHDVNIALVARKHPMKGLADFLDPYNNGEIHGVSSVFLISHDDLTSFDLTKITLICPKNDQDISYFMNKANIFISTSWSEGFGLPALEAMSCGCSVLISNSGGVTEYAKDGKNCLLFEPRNKEDLVKKLNFLIVNEKKRVRLSKNATIESKKFSWKCSADQLLDFLIILDKKS